MDYTTIKDLAKQIRDQHGLKCQVTDLIALAAQNDPFYVGTPTDLENGRWFAALFHRFSYGHGVHLRRIHYQIISQEEPVKMPNGEPYENTLQCWNFLEVASKAARYLELVRPELFVDRRNPDPHIFAERDSAVPRIDAVNWFKAWYLSAASFPTPPEYEVLNYLGSQRYHLEIWVEKSTMNDVLLPLCQQYGVNLVTGVGEQSITSTVELVQRAVGLGKPVRVFYVSDFDPAGRSMPVAVSRKTEFYLKKYSPSLDFRLFPVALSQEQCTEFELPRTPIKESERRKDRFEQVHGAGATELDALEALHPGQLHDILENHILCYYDTDLNDRVSQARAVLEYALDDRREEILNEYEEQLHPLRQQYREIEERFNQDVRFFAEKIEYLYAHIKADLTERAIDLHDYPVPKAAEGDEVGEGLFNSQRTYLDQLHAYKVFQGRSDGNGLHQLSLGVTNYDA